jgi:hypothetical protein
MEPPNSHSATDVVSLQKFYYGDGVSLQTVAADGFPYSYNNCHI